MASRTRIGLVALALIVLSTVLVGCGGSSLKIGWLALGGRQRKRAQYVTFDGTESKSFRVEAGQTVELACDVSVEKGSLSVTLLSPDGKSLWQESFLEDREAFVTVTATETGLHILRIEGQETGGSFDISWRLKD